MITNESFYREYLEARDIARTALRSEIRKQTLDLSDRGEAVFQATLFCASAHRGGHPTNATFRWLWTVSYRRARMQRSAERRRQASIMKAMLPGIVAALVKEPRWPGVARYTGV